MEEIVRGEDGRGWERKKERRRERGGHSAEGRRR